jgi:carbamoyl-phosphate synthase large subunit
MKILVSGAGGDIGVGVGRVLKEWGIFDRLYGIDVSDDHPAKIIFDQVNIAPRSDDSSYLEWLCNFISNNAIDLFIPTSESEIFVISNNIDQIKKHTKILINDQLIVNKSLDKWETLNFLASNGVAVPNNGILGQDIPLNFPVIVKPRRGHGSKDLQKIETKSVLKNCPKDSVWQDYLKPSDQEYTCAVYVSKDFNLKTLLIKRLLVGGNTGKGVVVKNKKIKDYVESIAKAFNKPGCYNVQLTLTTDGPRIFEINPRLSSTLVFRDKLGFKDLRWWVSEMLNIEYSLYEDVAEGTRIYRGNSEYIFAPDNTEIYLDDIDEKWSSKNVNIYLEKIIPTSDQLNLLYNQLGARSHNISHKVLPSYEEHKDFVKNNPYRAWFIVRYESTFIGNTYIQFDNSVGLNLGENITSYQIQKILSLICSQLPPLESVPSSRRGSYFVNVPSSNISLQKKLNLIKCKEIQRAYTLPDYLNAKKSK